MYYKRFAIGDKNDDESRFLPFNDDDMTYILEEHTYQFEEALIKNELDIDLGLYYGTKEAKRAFMNDIRDQLLEEIYDNPNLYATEISEFKIARWKKSRLGFKKAFLAQLRYADRTGKDMQEWSGISLSERAVKILRSQQYGFIASKGAYNYRVNPNITDDDGYRNGY